MTTFEISNGIQMLDDMDIAHRDIKPENILLSVVRKFHNVGMLQDFRFRVGLHLSR